MSEFNNNEFDKSLEDLGWSQMRTRLDKEMPVTKPKKSRRFIFFFLSFGLMCSIGLWAYNVVSFNNAHTSENPVLLDNRKVIKIDTAIAQKQTVIDNKIMELPLQNKQKTEGSFYSDKKIFQYKNIKFKNIDKNIHVYKKENQIVNIQNRIENQTEIIENTKEKQHALFNIDADTVLINTARTDINTHNLKTLNYNDLLAIKNNEPHLTNDFMIKNKDKWHFGILSGVHTEGGGFGGVQLGILAEKRLSSRWLFETQMNYRFHLAKNLDNTFLQLKQSGTSAMSLDPQSNLLPSEYVNLKNLSFVDISPRIHYAINNEWHIVSGLRMSILVVKNIKIMESAPVFVVNNTSSSRASAFDISNTYNLKNINVGVNAGIQYNYSKKWHFTLQYDQSIMNTWKLNSESYYFKGLYLNTIYMF